MCVGAFAEGEEHTPSSWYASRALRVGGGWGLGVRGCVRGGGGVHSQFLVSQPCSGLHIWYGPKSPSTSTVNCIKMLFCEFCSARDRSVAAEPAQKGVGEMRLGAAEDVLCQRRHKVGPTAIKAQSHGSP